MGYVGTVRMVSSVALNPVIDWGREDRDLAILVADVARGDERALATLYDRTSRIVYGLALRIVREASCAEDITLEVYAQVWRTAERYDPDRGAVSSWLVTLVRSRAIDWLRSRRGRNWRVEETLDEASPLPDSRPTPELATIEAGRAQLVRRAMADLPPEQRKMIELAYFSGMTHSEIADRSDLPLGTVKTRLRMGVLRLRELLGPYAEGM